MGKGLYIQTKWVEKEIKRDLEMRMFQIHIENFERKMSNQYGKEWQKVKWEDMGKQMRASAMQTKNIRDSLAVLQKMDKDGKKPPPLQYDDRDRPVSSGKFSL